MERFLIRKNRRFVIHSDMDESSITSDGEIKAPILETMDSLFAQGFQYLLNETKIPSKKDDGTTPPE